ncbi:MAG: hypothetical protein LBF40_00420 [Deltaproteobacteria bacterium]|nr:hypothetical protein [Deltaproteobacteria bacterium]
MRCLSLALIKNSLGFPVFMKPLSGNCSDNEEMNSLMRIFLDSIQNTINDKKSPIFITDTAFYTKNNISDFPAKFITRVPEILKDACELKNKNIEMQSFP